MIRTVLRCAAPSVLLAFVILVPFYDKAFTIDDTWFLLQAQHALSDPLHYSAFELVWSGVTMRSNATGPVMPWLLAPSVLAGGAEWLAHLVVFGMLSMALLASVSLALRLGLAPRWATVAGVLLAATPAAIGMAGTAMPDVPAMALGIAGIERLVAWKQERRIHQAVLAAFLLGLAPLARQHFVLLLGVGALLLADCFHESRWRSMAWTTWLPLLAAPLLTLMAALLTRDTNPAAAGLLNAHLGARQELLSGATLVPNSIAFATHWVLAAPLAVPWFLLRSQAIVRRWWVLLVATGATGWLLYAGADLRPGMVERHSVALAPIAGLGVAVLWDILSDGLKRRDPVQIPLGLWLLLPLAAAAYIHLPPKYLLISAPAAAILLARQLSACGKQLSRLVFAMASVLGLALGLVILRADAAFAGMGRRAAAEFIAPQVAAGQRVWFAGHWGFQWYALKAGARSVTPTPPYPAAGDLVVWSLKTNTGEDVRRLLQSYGRHTVLGTMANVEPGGRVMSTRLGAGFFSNYWGYLPWAWGDDILDAFELWRVE